MENQFESQIIEKFKKFKLKNLKMIKGGDGEDPGASGLIGTDEIGEA